MIIALTLATFLAAAAAAERGGVTTVACTGDSITAGYLSTGGQTYPAQLQALLGADYKVENYGEGGRTMLKRGDNPYWRSPGYKNALKSNASIVILMLGTNDAKHNNWGPHADEFPGDYADMIASFADMPSKPKVAIMVPPPLYRDGTYNMNQTVINTLFPGHGPAGIRTIAAQNNLSPPIDLFSMFQQHCPVVGGTPGHPNNSTVTKCDWIARGGTDACHPDNVGYGMLAKAVKHALFPSGDGGGDYLEGVAEPAFTESPLTDAAINTRLEFAPPVSMGEGTAWMSGFVRMGPPSGARTVFTGSLGKGGWRTSRDGGDTWKADQVAGGSFFPSVLSDDQLSRTNFGNISAYNASFLYTHFEGSGAQELRLDPASGNLTVSTLPNHISFRGIPAPGVRPLRLGGADSLKLQDGTWLLSAMTWTPPPGPGHCTGTNCTEYSLYAFRSRDGFTWNYSGVIASATAVPYAEEGPSEDGLAQLANGDIICVFRVDGGDGLHHRHLPYVLTRSTDNGFTWSKPLALPQGVGSARPKLRALSTGGLLLAGGRTSNFNHDVLLWLNDGLNLTNWSPYSISYRHNLLCNQSRDFNASNPYGPMIPFDAKVNSSSWPGESSSYNSLLFTSDTEFVITYSQWRHHMGALWRDFAMAVKIVPTEGS